MDEATKAGYGVLLMRQALPKSEFYAKTTAKIRSSLDTPAPGPADTIPFGVLGRGPARQPLDLAKGAHVAALAARLDSLHGATAQAAARGAPRSDGLDEATLALYARLAQLLDADPIGRIEALRTEQRQAVAEAKAARAQGAQVLAKAEQMEARLDKMESTISQTVTDAIDKRVSTRIDAIAADPATAFSVQMTYVELYNNQFRDLLAPTATGPAPHTVAGKGPGIAIHESRRQGIFLTGSASLRTPVTSSADALALVQAGNRRRAVGATALNSRSSRSHAILTFHVESQPQAAGGAAPPLSSLR